ncbi:MAG: hypothetical protein GX557_09305, partial [Chloroflexi bacterium]|nr:hypothetical protein [Chloroflexota bacterium]
MRQQRATLRWQQILLVALVVLSTALRLWRLDAKGLWWDESLSLYRAQQPLDVILRNEIVVPGSVTTDQHPPLYFVLLSGVVRLGGESDWALRFLSVAWAALLVVLLYLMGTRLRNRQAGLLAALCGALSPFLLWYAQEARMYTMVAVLGLAAFYALWRALDEHRWTWGLAAALLAIAAVGTQYLFGLVLPCALALAICLWPRTLSAETARAGPRPLRRRHRLALALGISALLLAIAATVAVVVRLLPTLATGRQYIPLPEMVADALNAYSLGLSVERAQVWPLLLVFAAVYLFGVVSLWRRPPVASASPGALRWAGLVLTVGYVLTPILGMWALSLFVPIYMGSRYVLLSSPAFYLGLGLGLEALGRRWRWPAWVIGAVLVAAMGLSTYRYFGVDRYAA